MATNDSAHQHDRLANASQREPLRHVAAAINSVKFALVHKNRGTMLPGTVEFETKVGEVETWVIFFDQNPMFINNDVKEKMRKGGLLCKNITRGENFISTDRNASFVNESRMLDKRIGQFTEWFGTEFDLWKREDEELVPNEETVPKEVVRSSQRAAHDQQDQPADESGSNHDQENHEQEPVTGAPAPPISNLSHHSTPDVVDSEASERGMTEGEDFTVLETEDQFGEMNISMCLTSGDFPRGDQSTQGGVAPEQSLNFSMNRPNRSAGQGGADAALQTGGNETARDTEFTQYDIFIHHEREDEKEARELQLGLMEKVKDRSGRPSCKVAILDDFHYEGLAPGPLEAGVKQSTTVAFLITKNTFEQNRCESILSNLDFLLTADHVKQIMIIVEGDCKKAEELLKGDLRYLEIINQKSLAVYNILDQSFCPKMTECFRKYKHLTDARVRQLSFLHVLNEKKLKD